MAGKNYEIAFQIGARLAGTFKGAFASAASTMGDLQKKSAALSKASGQVGKYQDLQQRITSNQAAMLAMRKRAGELASEMKNCGTPTQAMTKNLAQLSRNAEDLQKKLDRDRSSLAKMRPDLVGAGVDMRNLGAEQARLAAQSDKLAAARLRMEKSQGAVQAARNRLSWNNMKGELVASAGILMAIGVPIKTAANFEQAMAKVGAVSGASVKELARLADQSRALGRDTQFTAMQAAQGQELLARAGFQTDEIMAAMPGMLNMAAAEGMELGQAADIASSVLRGFGFQAGESARVADVLAKASAATNTSIAGLGDSMKYVAPIAKSLGIPFEDTAAMIGIMGNAGIKGSEAGTALRAALVRLSKEPKQTAEAMKKLGISAKDAKGNMRTLPSLMKALSERMKGMGKAEQMGELSKIFGTEAASGMLALMQGVKSGDLASVAKEMYAAGGAAQDMAQKMNATAQGAMKRLSSATESVMIDVGNVLLPIFTEGAEKIAAFTSKASQLAQKYPEVTKILVGSIAALGALKVGMTALGIVSTALKLPFLELYAVSTKLRAAYILADGSIVQMAKNSKVAAVASKIWAGAQWLLNAAMNANPMVWVVVGIVALVAALVLAYKKCAWFRDGVNKALAAVAGFFQAAFEKIAGLIDWVGEKWNKFKEFLGIAPKIPVPESQAVPVPMPTTPALPSGGVAIAAHAAGGIFSQPHFGIVAENKKREAIVPIDNPSRGIPLWAAAGRLMGLDGFGGFAGAANSETITQNYYSISIPVQGNADEGIVEKIRGVVRDVMREFEIDEERLAFP